MDTSYVTWDSSVVESAGFAIATNLGLNTGHSEGELLMLRRAPHVNPSSKIQPVGGLLLIYPVVLHAEP